MHIFYISVLLFFIMDRFNYIYLSFFVFLILFLGISPVFGHEQKKDDLNLDPRLKGLLDSTDKDVYAETHNIEYSNGSVEVVVEIYKNRSFPTGYSFNFHANTTYKDRVFYQGKIPINQIDSLKNRSEILDIRLPETPKQVGQNNNNQISTQKNTSNSTNNNGDGRQPRNQSSILGTITASLGVLSVFLVFYLRKVKKDD